MDHAPLERAQAHLRAASSHALRSDNLRASSAHAEAAREFGTAAANASTTTAAGEPASEAARLLTLLEQHHARVARIIRSQAVSSAASSSSSSTVAAGPAVIDEQGRRPSSQRSVEGGPDLGRTLPGEGAPSPRGVRSFQPPQKDMATSLATGLASARGIPARTSMAHEPGSTRLGLRGRGGPDTSVQTETARPGDASQMMASNPSTASDLTEVADADADADADAQEPPSVIQEAYARFQSSFGYLFSSLSSPLAFAGLPLNPDEAIPATLAPGPSSEPLQPTKRPPQDPHRSQLAGHESRAPAPIDLTSFFSAAAVRAANTPDPPAAHLAESFYVVPSDLSGRHVTPTGTSVLLQRSSRHPPEPRSTTATAVAATAEVTATSSGSGASMLGGDRTGPTLGPGPRHARSMAKTVEELALENEALRLQVDHFSTRLQAFQTASQSASMALHRSLRSLRSASPAAADDSRRRGDGSAQAGRRPAGVVVAAAAVDRHQQASPRTGETGREGDAKADDGELRELRAELARLSGDNAKLKRSADRYKDKYRHSQKEAAAAAAASAGRVGVVAAAAAAAADPTGAMPGARKTGTRQRASGGQETGVGK